MTQVPQRFMGRRFSGLDLSHTNAQFNHVMRRPRTNHRTPQLVKVGVRYPKVRHSREEPPTNKEDRSKKIRIRLAERQSQISRLSQRCPAAVGVTAIERNLPHHSQR